MIPTKKTNGGFTLLQLLFSIVIMGLLISVVITSLNPSRIKGRDSKRLSDLNQMKVALEFYREANGNYPYTCNPSVYTPSYSNVSFDSVIYGGNHLCTTPNGNTKIVPNVTLTQAMAPYVAQLKDPKLHANGDSGYLYTNTSVTQPSYCFMMWRTPENLRNFPSTTVNPARCPSVDSNGQCSAGSNSNSVYIGKGTYATIGC